jgi:hypothetical protein
MLPSPRTTRLAAWAIESALAATSSRTAQLSGWLGWSEVRKAWYRVDESPDGRRIVSPTCPVHRLEVVGPGRFAPSTSAEVRPRRLDFIIKEDVVVSGLR